MIKFSSAVALTATIALLEGAEAVHQNHQWRYDRVARTKYRLERAYGKGAVDLFDEYGRIREDRLGWTRRDGQKLGASLNVEFAPGQIMDASTIAAYALGIVNGFQYKGLNRAEEAGGLPIDGTELTNCFASTYALIESFDTAAYNIKTFAKERGTLKLFDVGILDPFHILADFSVEWTMCDINGLIDQTKSMFSLDYSAMANHLTREILVLAIDLPKDLKKINTLKSAVTCATQKAKSKTKKAVEEEEEEEEEELEDEEDFWGVFKADVDYTQLAVSDVTDCIDGINRWEIGQTIGNFISTFFSRDLKPVI